ncbi:MAG: hypothetical protein KAV44_06370 [Bacteroidales bacterium]|nr:hypothetical protein [Bacteroidales bacterium]
MITQEIKTEIHKVIDNLPDAIASDVLDYLKGLLNKTKHDLTMSRKLAKIIKEDKELLEKLAQ